MDVISKEEALKIFKNRILPKYDVDYSTFSISSNIINSQDVKEYMGGQVFPASHDKGYLIFVDPLIIANWSHRCFYYFIVNDCMIFKSKQCWFPKIYDKIEEIKLEDI